MNALYRLAEGLNRTFSEDDVARTVVDFAIELPGVQAAWIFLRDDESSAFRLAASRNLPPAIEESIARDGPSALQHFPHALSVPIRLNDREVGLLHLVRSDEGLVLDEELEILDNVANQVAVAIDRIRLRETKERLTNTLESISDALIALDTDWKFTYVNPQGEQLLQHSREELLGRVMWEVFPDSYESQAGREYRRATEEQKPARISEFNPSLKLWMDIRAYPSRQGLTLYARDVSAEHESSQRIVEQSSFIDQAHDGIMLRDLDHRILFWSKGAERLYGHSSAEAIGHRFDELLQIDGAVFHQAIDEVLRNGSWSGEIEKTTSSGTTVTVEGRWTLVRDESGNPKAILALDNDITEQKKAQLRLRESEERYELIFDRNPHPTWVYDLHSLAFLAVNNAAIQHYGYSRAEFLRMTIKDIRPQEDVAELLEVIETQPETPVARSYGVFRHRTKAGAIIEVEISSSEVRFAGRPAGLVLAIDVTERRLLEKQLIRSQRMESLGTLAGGIAHDLNNLLMPVMMGASLLRKDETSAVRLRAIDTIERSARRGKDMVRQVLSFARGVEGARVPVNIGDAVHEIEAIVESTFPKNISIRTDVSPDLWLIDGDPTQVNQVLMNLCVNARDAMPRGGQLRVSARNADIDDQYARMHRGMVAGRYVILEVVDDGVGMQPYVVDRVFEPFFTTKDVGRGTGLGLSTVAAIVRSHSGFVSVYSEVDKGTSFKVYLPARRHTETAPTEIEPAPLTLPRGKGETVLVVDDETSILAITQQTLEAFDYRVLTAQDGAQAIALYALHRAEIAVVITDMMMPVMDGTVFIAALRRIDPDVRIIASSGYSEHEDAGRTTYGPNAFLHKPYSADVLLVTLRNAIDRKN